MGSAWLKEVAECMDWEVVTHTKEIFEFSASDGAYHYHVIYDAAIEGDEKWTYWLIDRHGDDDHKGRAANPFQIFEEVARHARRVSSS